MRRFAQAFADVDVLPIGLPDEVAAALAGAPDRYNIGKGKPACVLAMADPGGAVAADMAWGLVPRWSREPATRYTTVTARLERAPTSRVFAQAWKQRPCVVPMSGYYKWARQHPPPWPHFIQRSDGLALLAAGLWERWDDADTGASLLSFTILTGPNPAIPSPLTKDGPVFLDPSLALRWLAGDITSPATLARRALQPALESYPVSRRIRDPALDDYTLLEPADPVAEAASRLDEEEASWDDADADD